MLSDSHEALSHAFKKAGLRPIGCHVIHHTFGTHAALFGVNPWRLQIWLGHKRIDGTMLSVHVSEAHAREIWEAIRIAASSEQDPDRRIIKMLASRGSHVAAAPVVEDDLSMKSSA